LLFVVLVKFKKKPTKEVLAESDKLFEKAAEEGLKIHAVYYTLGRYDAVGIFEHKDEKAAMKSLLRLFDIDSTETLVAVPREEARKLLD